MKDGTAIAFLGKKEREVFDLQRLQQPVADRGEHGVEIGFGAELSREFDQGEAVIVTVFVEMAVEAFLNPVANGLEEERGDEHDDDEAGVADILEILLH